MTRIAIVEGDGIGHEVIPVARRVLELLHPEYEYFDVDVGYGRWERTGCPCTDPDIAELKTADAILFGAITTPPMKDYQSVVLRIRKALDLYANLRPVKNDGFDIMIVRENTEGLYSGIEEADTRPCHHAPGRQQEGYRADCPESDRSCTAEERTADHRAQGKCHQVGCLFPGHLPCRGKGGRYRLQ